MKLNERIEAIVSYSKKNISQFSQYVGFKTPQAVRELIAGRTKNLSDAAYAKIMNAFPELSSNWLLTGEGDMINPDYEPKHVDDDQVDSSKYMIPLVHIDSVGGIHSNNSIDASEQYVERLIPFPDVRPGDVAILQSGDSMAPNIPAGAIIQIRQVEDWREYFGYGNDFVLWLTDDRRITKQVLKYKPDPANYVTCHSYNPEADDEELPKSMIRQVWKVVKVLINNGW